MKVVAHPYLAGVKCREDGAVFVPTSGTNKAHWTFGVVDRAGYCIATISRKHRRVHRLICEAFHGLCPEDKCQVDHLDRNPSNNRPENLHWCTPAENVRNRSVCIKAMEGVVSQIVDRKAYSRALYANSPEYREHRKAQKRERYANDTEYRKHISAYNHEYHARKRAEIAV